MNVLKTERFLAELIPAIIDNSKPSRILECRRCGSIEIHDQKYSVETRCKHGFKTFVDDKVPLAIKCENCGSQKGFDFLEDSGVEETELIDHEMYGKGKASLLENNSDDFQYDEEYSSTEDYEHILANIEDDVELAENNPEVKGKIVKQIHTIEPSDGFDSAGYNEYDTHHKADIQNTWYTSFVNPGNTPHMQTKVPIEELIAIINSKAMGIKRAMMKQSYGSRKVHDECLSKMGFPPEVDNRGNRKLNDRQIMKTLNDFTFTKKKINDEGEELSKTYKGRLALEELENKLSRLRSVLRTGNLNCGFQETEFKSRDNNYDKIEWEKLAMEQDVAQNVDVMDIYKMYLSSKST